MPSRKTNEEFIVELSKANPNIQPIEEYKSALKKIRFRCLIDMHEWSAIPNNLLMGHGCPLCSFRKSSERLLRTNEEFLSRLNSINPNICPIEKYVDSQTKIMCRCTIDGYEWRVRPNVRKEGCPCRAPSMQQKQWSQWMQGTFRKVQGGVSVVRRLRLCPTNAPRKPLQGCE